MDRTLQKLNERQNNNDRASKGSLEDSLSVAVRPSMLSSSYQADMSNSFMTNSFMNERPSNHQALIDHTSVTSSSKPVAIQNPKTGGNAANPTKDMKT